MKVEAETQEQFQALLDVVGSNPYTREVETLLRRYEHGEVEIDDLIIMLWDAAPPSH